eukprot:1068616-Pelagomonas_calceolata.AAC.3
MRIKEKRKSYVGSENKQQAPRMNHRPSLFTLTHHAPCHWLLQVCTSKMNLSDEVDLEDYVSRPDKISAAEIAAVCQEAGMHAVRKNRYVILPKDFERGYKANIKKGDSEFAFYQ